MTQEEIPTLVAMRTKHESAKCCPPALAGMTIRGVVRHAVFVVKIFRFLREPAYPPQQNSCLATQRQCSPKSRQAYRRGQSTVDGWVCSETRCKYTKNLQTRKKADFNGPAFKGFGRKVYLIASMVETFSSDTPIERRYSAILASRAKEAASFFLRSCSMPCSRP